LCLKNERAIYRRGPAWQAYLASIYCLDANPGLAPASFSPNVDSEWLLPERRWEWVLLSPGHRWWYTKRRLIWETKESFPSGTRTTYTSDQP
jgi:hypothetical protein